MLEKIRVCYERTESGVVAMIIQDEEHGEFDVWLVDDGTLDTVLEVCQMGALLSTAGREIRFSQERGAECRDETGAVTNVGFAELAHEAVKAYIEQYLI